MSSHPPKHSNALLIAWCLAELAAANLRSDELEPIHFFLGLLNARGRFKVNHPTGVFI
jgi:hypothetical protein